MHIAVDFNVDAADRWNADIAQLKSDMSEVISDIAEMQNSSENWIRIMHRCTIDQRNRCKQCTVGKRDETAE